jgi:uncharacterized membrane protein YfcA
MFAEKYIRLFYGFLTGFISGILGGMLGLSGPMIILPILVFFDIFKNYKMAIATVLFGFEPFGSLFALIQYAKEKKIDYVMGLIIAVAYMGGSYIGAKFNKMLSEKKIKNISASIMMFLSIYMFYNANE